MHRGTNLAEGLTITERGNCGITTRITFAGDTVVLDMEQDMEPILRYVAEMRERNAARPFAADKELGHIPELFYRKINLIKDSAERRKAVRLFFKQNPAFCAYQPLLS